MALLSTIVAGCLLALLGAFSGDATLSRVAESLLASLFFLFPSLVIASLLLVPIVYLVIALIPARARRLAMCMLFPVPFVGWAAYVYQGIPDLTGLLPAVAALIAGAFVPLPRVEYETHLPARTRMFQTTLAFGALLLGAVLAIQLLSAPYVLPSAAQYAGELADFQRPVDSAEPPPIPAGATVLAEFSGHGDGEELLVYLGFPAGSEYSVLASCSGTSLQFAQVSSDADSSFASRVVVPCSEPPSIQREVPLPSSGRAELRVFPAADQDWFLTVVAP
jgi:hypothetical protein